MAKQGGKMPAEAVSAPNFENLHEGQKAICIDGEDMYLKIGTYANAKLAMSLSLETAEGEPYATISKCFGNIYREGTFVPNCSTFIDTNNCPDSLLKPVFEALGGEQRTVFGTPYSIESGFCEYPMYDFSYNKLKEYDPKGFEAYQKDYADNFGIEQRKLSVEMFGEEFEDEQEEQFDI